MKEGGMNMRTICAVLAVAAMAAATELFGAEDHADRVISDVLANVAKLKAADPMAWVQRMNSIRSRAEEIVTAELIYH